MAHHERHPENGHQSELWPSRQRGVEQRAHDTGKDQKCELLPCDFRLLLEVVRLHDDDRSSGERRAAGEEARSQREGRNRKQGKERRVSELEDPDVLAADKRVQRGREHCQAEHGLVWVQMPHVPYTVHHGLVEVEVLGVDVEADDIRAAHACEKHQRKTAAVEDQVHLTAMHSIGQRRARRDHDGHGDEDQDGERISLAVVEPRRGYYGGEWQEQRPEPARPSDEVGAFQFERGCRSVPEACEPRQSQVEPNQQWPLTQRLVHTQWRPDKIHDECRGDEDRDRRARQIRDVPADRRRGHSQSAEKQLPREHG